jgi:hypothetical protein
MSLPPHLAPVASDAPDGSQRGSLARIAAGFLAFIDALRNVGRAAWLALIFTPVLLSAPLALSWDVYRAEWMELLRKTLEAGGPAFIKWGQVRCACWVAKGWKQLTGSALKQVSGNRLQQLLGRDITARYVSHSHHGTISVGRV